MEGEIFPPERSSDDALRTLTLVVYTLQALGFFTGGLTMVAGVMVNYIKMEDAEGSLYHSHFRWQVRTFWWGLLWLAIGLPACLIVIGYAILAADAFWIIYRIIKGFIYWNDKRPMPIKGAA